MLRVEATGSSRCPLDQSAGGGQSGRVLPPCPCRACHGTDSSAPQYNGWRAASSGSRARSCRGRCGQFCHPQDSFRLSWEHLPKVILRGPGAGQQRTLQGLSIQYSCGRGIGAHRRCTRPSCGTFQHADALYPRALACFICHHHPAHPPPYLPPHSFPSAVRPPRRYSGPRWSGRA